MKSESEPFLNDWTVTSSVDGPLLAAAPTGVYATLAVWPIESFVPGDTTRPVLEATPAARSLPVAGAGLAAEAAAATVVLVLLESELLPQAASAPASAATAPRTPQQRRLAPQARPIVFPVIVKPFLLLSDD